VVPDCLCLNDFKISLTSKGARPIDAHPLAATPAGHERPADSKHLLLSSAQSARRLPAPFLLTGETVVKPFLYQQRSQPCFFAGKRPFQVSITLMAAKYPPYLQAPGICRAYMFSGRTPGDIFIFKTIYSTDLGLVIPEIVFRGGRLAAPLASD
jgi:hypothetical protein